MPQWRALIKRLVREVKEVEPSPTEDLPIEDLPIEEYEIRELARTRVILKYSIKVHLLTYICVNFLLVTVNVFALSPDETFWDFWAFWVILSWGFLLWMHILIGLSIYFKTLENRLFFIVALDLFYLSGLLIFLNYLTIHHSHAEFLWWPWSSGGIITFIGVYAFIVFETDDKKKMDIRVKKELSKITKQREEQHKEDEEKEKKSTD